MNLTHLNQTIIDQQAEAQEYQNTNSLIVRDQLLFFQEWAKSKLISVIIGIRRSGKSTLALQFLKNRNFLYFNFDDEILGQIEAKDLNKMLEQGLTINPHAEYLFFDEIQNVEGWELFVNRLHRRKFKIIITGSNSRMLSTELSTHLTGRHLSLSLFPFSFFEFLKFKKVDYISKNLTTNQIALFKSQFREYFNRGGFPEIINYEETGLIFKQYLKELFDKIVTRDIVQRRKIKNVKTIKELALLSLSLYASQFTYQSLKKLCGINSLSTIKNYIDYLQEAYLIFILEPYSSKIKKRISLPKKFYIIDIAFIDAIIPKTTIDLGKKLENLVFIELKRRGHEVYSLHELSYEVDFAIKEGTKIVELIQVAWNLNESKTKQREIRALIKAAEQHSLNNKLTIITEDTEGEELIEGRAINIIPIWKWLLEHQR